MALPTTGEITAAMVNVELKRTSNAQFNMNGTAERGLAKVPSGQIAMSNFYGKSSEFVLNITANNHSVGTDWVWNLLGATGQAQTDIRIIVASGVQLVTANTGIRGVFDFYGGWGGKKIIIENYGYILGRGGAGGWLTSSSTWGHGAPGGRAIYTDGTATVTITNGGIIGGGGGGGACGALGLGGGGGGAPFGAGGYGQGSGTTGASGSLLTGGAGGAGSGQFYGSKGGDVGQGGSSNGGNSNGGPGGAGEATRGTINWAVLGDVRGARV